MRKIKSIFVFLLILAGFTTSVFAAGSRSDIDKFLKSYEEMVVAAEKAAKSNKINDLMKLSLKATELAEQVEKLEESDNWTTADAKKYLDLTTRYTKAASAITSNTMDSLDALSAFGF